MSKTHDTRTIFKTVLMNTSSYLVNAHLWASARGLGLIWGNVFSMSDDARPLTGLGAHTNTDGLNRLIELVNLRREEGVY